jgi:hypothetical protein
MRQGMEVAGMIIILKVVLELYAAVLGTVILGIVVLRIATTALITAVTTVFELFPPRISSSLPFFPLALCQPNAAFWRIDFLP